MKYEVGDRVKIKSLDWYNRYTNGTEVDCGAYPFTSDMKEFCGQERIIANVCQECYVLLGIDDKFVWTDEMIEELVEDENIDCGKCGLTRNSIGCLFMDNCLHNKQKNIIEIPEDYVLKDENGNVINATKIVLEKKKREYPKTFEECCKILGFLNVDLCFNADYRSFDTSKEQWKKLGLMNQFYQLLICRDAYWKIAGEEMELGKPWAPDYDYSSPPKYIISCYFGDIIKEKYCGQYNRLLSFPTEEMRDAFKENFDPDIEICKELL